MSDWKPSVRIGSREIGPGEPPYVIAEIGVNHDGEVARALELTDATADAGADAVKLQYFETDRLMSKAAKLAAYQKAAGETDPIEMLRRLELTLDEMALVVDRAHERGVHAIVTVFSVELVKPAAELAWDAFKSASPDVVNRPLLEALAAEGKPLIVSTGASTLDEVMRARGWLDAISDRLAFLHCVSSYPTQLDDASINAMIPMHQLIDSTIGYSDHTSDLDIGALAVRAGASILEKHFTYSRNAHGPDHSASLEPSSFNKYCQFARKSTPSSIWPSGGYPGAGHRQTGDPRLREADPRLGEPMKRVLDCERDVREVSRQSLVTMRDLTPGDTITRDDLTIKRPGTGIEPWRIDEIIGRTVSREVKADVPLTDDDLE